MASTRADPARDAAVLELEQTCSGHLVQVKAREPRRYPNVLRGLLTPHRFMTLTKIQIKPLASWLSQKRNRHDVLSGIHWCPLSV
ncbi:MAG: hypothetical protein ACTHJW_26720 [Streptosporangiaceae bacterium]